MLEDHGPPCSIFCHRHRISEQLKGSPEQARLAPSVTIKIIQTFLSAALFCLSIFFQFIDQISTEY